jgi:hypothetical protein
VCVHSHAAQVRGSPLCATARLTCSSISSLNRASFLYPQSRRSSQPPSVTPSLVFISIEAQAITLTDRSVPPAGGTITAAASWMICCSSGPSLDRIVARPALGSGPDRSGGGGGGCAVDRPATAAAALTPKCTSRCLARLATVPSSATWGTAPTTVATPRPCPGVAVTRVP